MAVKLYKNRSWLTRKYNKENLSVDEIAELCGVSRKTVYTQLKDFGLLRKSH